MSKDKDLFYQKFEWKDYLTSQRVKLMSLEEQGAYIRAIGECFMAGFLPADINQLRRLIGCGCSKKTAEKVAEMFEKNGEKLTQERITQDRENIEKLSKKNRQTAVNAWDRRKNGNANASANVEPTQYERSTNIIDIVTVIDNNTSINKKQSCVGNQFYEGTASDMLMRFCEGMIGPVLMQYRELTREEIFARLDKEKPCGYVFRDSNHVFNSFKDVAKFMAEEKKRELKTIKKDKADQGTDYTAQEATRTGKRMDLTIKEG